MIKRSCIAFFKFRQCLVGTGCYGQGGAMEAKAERETEEAKEEQQPEEWSE